MAGRPLLAWAAGRPSWRACGAGRQLGHLPVPGRGEALPGAMLQLQTQPLRARWGSTLLLPERLFRYVCPTA